jgi:hypothetical protein
MGIKIDKKSDKKTSMPKKVDKKVDKKAAKVAVAKPVSAKAAVSYFFLDVLSYRSLISFL